MVDSPKGKYRGHTPTKVVAKNIIAIIPAPIAIVPLIYPVKYKIATIAAIEILIYLSILPMFFFILTIFSLITSNIVS